MEAETQGEVQINERMFRETRKRSYHKNKHPWEAEGTLSREYESYYYGDIYDIPEEFKRKEMSDDSPDCCGSEYWLNYRR